MRVSARVFLWLLQNIRRYFDGNLQLNSAFIYAGQNKLFALRTIASRYN